MTMHCVTCHYHASIATGLIHPPVLSPCRKAAAAAAAAAADAGAPAAAAALLHSALGASVRTQYCAGLAGQLASLDKSRPQARMNSSGTHGAGQSACAGRDGNCSRNAQAAGARADAEPAAGEPGTQDSCNPDAYHGEGGDAGGAAGRSPREAPNSGEDRSSAQRAAWLRAAAVLQADGACMAGGAAGDLSKLEARPV